MDSSLTDFNPGEAFMNEPTQKDKNDESIMNVSCCRPYEVGYAESDSRQIAAALFQNVA